LTGLTPLDHGRQFFPDSGIPLPALKWELRRSGTPPGLSDELQAAERASAANAGPEMAGVG